MAEQLVTIRNKRGYAHQEWQKMRERNEALDCRVYARAAAAALGMDGWGDGRWARMADALSLPAAELPTGGNVAPVSPAQAAPNTHRPRGWLAPRSGWLR